MLIKTQIDALDLTHFLHSRSLRQLTHESHEIYECRWSAWKLFEPQRQHDKKVIAGADFVTQQESPAIKLFI